MLRWLLLVLLTVASLSVAWLYFELTARSGPVEASLSCYIGAYELSGQRSVVIVATENRGELMFVHSDGSKGRLKGGDKLGSFHGAGTIFERRNCRDANAQFRFASNRSPETAHKLDFRERAVQFASGGTVLAGKLILPSSGPVSRIVVWIAGSDDEGEIDRVHWQYTLPLKGVGSFVFDKRGSGASSGEVSANFHLRAADARAAVSQVRRLHGAAPVEIGVHGASQGGWVAPLAALSNDIDFVIVSYGLAEGVPAEDRDEMAAHLKEAGYGPEVIAKVRVLTDITAKIVKSHWQTGWRELAEWRSVHEQEPWVKALPSTSYTGFLLQIPNFAAGIIGPIIGPMFDKGVSFEYEPLPTLERLKVPQLWILGGKDKSAPSAATIPILRQLQARGTPLDLVIFPDADHGIIEPWPGEGHAQERLAPGYRELVADWSRTRDLPTDVRADVYRHR